MRRIVCILISLALALSVMGCSPSSPSLEGFWENTGEGGYASGTNALTDEYDALNKAFELDKTNRKAMSDLIAFHKDRGNYKACVDVYKDYLAGTYNDLDSLIDLAYCQMELGDYDSAEAACLKAIELNIYSPEAYNALGNVYGDLTEYQKAIEAYKKASSLDDSFRPSRTNTLWALFNSSQYELCIEEAKTQAEHDYESYDLYYYIGGSYEALNKPGEAADAYKRALEFEFDDYSDAYYHLGLLAFNGEDFDGARDYTKTALIHNPKNQDALWLSGELDNLSLPLNERLSDFIETQYLYRGVYGDFDKNLKRLEEAAKASPEEVVGIAGKALHPQDPFSFFITGTDYDSYLAEQENSSVSYSTKTISGVDCVLFNIYCFNPMTGKEFIKLADKIENPAQKVIIFNLRGNGGGDMKACSEILDYFLGDCVTVSFIRRDGYTSSYYSSADKVMFKKIIILTDNSTASASELLTLGLKVYCPDTLIIGDNTYGKGVSQNVFNDSKNKLALWLVSSYWNVREINIDGCGIQPDVSAKTQPEIDSALQNALSVIQ